MTRSKLWQSISTAALLLALGAPARAESGCAPVPPVVTDLNVPRFYSDEAGSIVDPVLTAQHEKAVIAYRHATHRKSR